jgi:hypothetical protein
MIGCPRLTVSARRFQDDSPISRVCLLKRAIVSVEQIGSVPRASERTRKEERMDLLRRDSYSSEMIRLYARLWGFILPRIAAREGIDRSVFIGIPVSGKICAEMSETFR